MNERKQVWLSYKQYYMIMLWKNYYDCQMWNICDLLVSLKEEILLPNVKYLTLAQSIIGILFIHT